MNDKSIKNAPEIVWHYTRSEYLPMIEDAGELRPKSELEFAKDKQRLKDTYISSVPLIWFSSNQHWEHSTSQLIGWRYQNWQELALKHSAIRYGIASSDKRLLDWNQTCEITGSNREERRQRKKLITQARKAGSNPSLWFSSPVAIPLQDLRFEMFIYGGWTSTDSASLFNYFS